MVRQKDNQRQKIIPRAPFPPSLPPSLPSHHHVQHVHLLPLKQRWQRLLLPLNTTKARGPHPKAQVRQELHTKLTNQIIHRHNPIMVLPVISPARAARAVGGGSDPPSARGRRSRGLGGGAGAGRAGAACLKRRGGWEEGCVSELRLVYIRAVLKVAI